MLTEALQFLVTLGQKSKAVEFHHDKDLPRTVFVRVGDELMEKDVPPIPRQHAVAGMDDLVRAVLSMGVGAAGVSQIFVDRKRVVALLDGEDRRDYVSVDLCETRRFSLVRALAEPRKFEPRDAVKLLRFDLHGTQVEHVIQALKRIDFLRTSSGRTNVEHGRESLGRSVEASVQQADEVPDRFSLTVPIWSNPGFSRYSTPVEFGVFLDLEAQKVELRVLADEVERACNQVIATIASDLRDLLGDRAEVFLGSP